MAEATYVQEGKIIDWTPTADVLAGEVLQLPDGRAAIATTDIPAGEQGSVQVSGIVEVLKTASMVMLKGTKLWWDVSASKASVIYGLADRDFYIGVVQEAAASAATTVKVALNVEPRYTLALADGILAAPIPAITANPKGMMFQNGNGVNAVFDTAAEAQKFDALSIRSIAPNTPGLLNAIVCVNTNGDDAAFDLNIGMADDTHATSADTINASLFCHVDGGSADILVESDDNVTEVNATDSTVDFVAGTPFLFQVDLTDWSDPQVYINGVNVLPASVFDISSDLVTAWKLLFHMEKSANDSPGNVTTADHGFIAYDV